MNRHAPIARRCLAGALNTSALVWVLALPGAAHAQCAPDPTVAGQVTTCSGTDTDGVRVTTKDSSLTVAAAASVSAIVAPAVTVQIPVDGSYLFTNNTINILGNVSAPGQNAITVYSFSDNANGYYNSTQTQLTVGVDGRISGTTALTLLQSPGNDNGTISVSVDNAGTLTGTGGTALLGNVVSTKYGYDNVLASFSSITNRSTGQIIGGLVGAVANLTNAGMIDSGAGSAVDAGGVPISPNINNASGASIRSASAAATVRSGPSYYLNVTNAGEISNTGAGAALSGGSLYVTNQAGGIIAGGGPAITASASLNLINQGIVTGNIVTGTGSSMIDSTAGTINGSVTFGSNDDTLIARYAGTPTLATGIIGAIDDGGGTNTERVVFAVDTSVTTPIDLAAGFKKLVLAPNANVTATLETGFSTTTLLVLNGSGTVINRATINLAGPTINDLDYAFGSSASFRNEGSITSSSFGNAITFSNRSFTNTGSVNAAGGGGVSMSYNPVNNSGTIIASQTGVYVFDGVLTNSGTVVSTAGAGINLFGNVGYTASNSGTIRGSTTGAITDVYLTNTGTISSAGLGVEVQPYGYLINAAGGIVNGGTGGAVTASINAGVANAGTITGDATLSGIASLDLGLAYIALPGGTLNGNLNLNSGATLVTNLINEGPGQFDGIAGRVVSDGTAKLRYAVDADVNAALSAGDQKTFAAVGYQLSNGAHLTLTAPATQIQSQILVLAGNGSVDLDANISVTGLAALQTTTPLSYPGAPAAANALSITNRGTLSISRSSDTASYYLGAAVNLTGTDSFVNFGTISVNDPTYTIYTAGIRGGTTVTNAGSILLDGGSGISTNGKIVNTGKIIQVDGGAIAVGVVNPESLDNSGTISVGGTAVTVSSYYGSGRITNSGTIASTGGIAITGSDASATAQITNNASGAITGTGGTAIRLYYGIITNAGTVNGNVDLGYGFPYYSGASSRSYTGSVYVAAGGTIAGDLLFGDGPDLLLQASDSLGISGTIDGGGGANIYGRSLSSSGTIALEATGITNFNDRLVQAGGTDTTITVTAANTFQGNLYAAGTGNIVNQASITGTLTTALPYPLSSQYVSNILFPTDQVLSSITNNGTILGGVSATTTSLVNTGTIAPSKNYGATITLNSGNSSLKFVNSGTITGTLFSAYYYSFPIISIFSGSSLDFINNGTIITSGSTTYPASGLSFYAQGDVTIKNAGTIDGAGLFLELAGSPEGPGYSVDINNTGTITGSPGSSALYVSNNYDTGTTHVRIDNSGTLSAKPSDSGDIAIGLYSSSGPISAFISNTGTINGNIALAGGANTVDNVGTINGTVALGSGDDTFIQHRDSTVSGLVYGGDGIDTYVIDTTGGSTSLNATQISNFERVTQTGSGTGTYAGNFGVDTITLGSGTLAVGAGQTLATTGPTTITGSDTGVSVTNAGTILGGITLGSGADTVINNGTITGPVQLGAGDDSFTEGPGSNVAGGVDGGDGTDTYRVVLAGDRSGIGMRTNFEQLAVDGTGTLTLALDQNFQSIALNGTNLTAVLGGFTIGRIDGSAAPARISIDGDAGAVALGNGDDTLSLGATNAAGRYDGGGGTNMLRLTASTPVTLTGSATNFQTIALTGGALTVTGTLGNAGGTLSFGDGAQSLTVASGGTLAGAIDLGAGDDNFRLAAGGTLAGTVAGGAGTDIATLEIPGAMTLLPGILTGFERLVTDGRGVLTLAGGATAFAAVGIGGDLTIASDASLATSQLSFGPAGGHLTIAGGFTGSVAGGTGNDSIDISGGSAASPVAFGSISDVEALRMSAGFATVTGTASLGSIALTGGRLVGLAGSTISAPTITVGTNATFGSAGTVNGNIAVSGILSPGASPGTMTVNGNVALAGSSISLFEITPAVSDKLIVNGTVSIAQGATLQLVPSDGVKPGQSLDLIVASGGISGSFTNIVKPASLFGVVLQQAGKLTLLGEFLNDASFSPQVRRSVDYVNSVLTSGKASAALLAAAPQLVTSTGASNQAAFAEITPEAYASARQLTVEQGLELADAGRSDAFATRRDTAGAFTFASMLGNTRTLRSNDATGTSRARTNGYGFLGGLGWGSRTWSIGGFVGYLDSHQTLALPGTKTEADGFVAGVHGRWTDGRFGLKATIAYDGSKATTRRALPGSSATGDYHLHGWTADASLDYAIALGANWTIRPSIGATAIRATRDRVVESGGNAFALDVARDHGHALFVDGALTVSGGTQGDATVRPFLSVGVRHQLDGRTPYALAALGGGDYGLTAAGAPRASVLGTATLGADVVLSQRLVLFGAVSGEAGKADRRGSAHAGLRLAF